MATPGVTPVGVDAYLDALARRLRHHPESDDVLAEVADHLDLTVARLKAEGLATAEAERAAVLRFGEPKVIGRLMTPAGFMPRLLLCLSVTAALAWPLSAVMYAAQALSDPWNESLALGWSVVAASTVLLTALCLVLPHLAALSRSVTTVLVVVVAASVAFQAVFSWMWMVPVLGLAVVATVVRSVAREEGRLLPVLVLGMLLWSTVAYVGSGLGVPPLDDYGYPIYPPLIGYAGLAVTGVVCVLLTARVRADDGWDSHEIGLVE